MDLTQESTDADTANLLIQVGKLQRRLDRERRARLEAEAIAEKGLRELYDRQQQLLLLETIATQANQSTSVEETFRLALVEICRYTNWSLGHMYDVVAGEPSRLVPSRIWHTPSRAALLPFLDDTLTREFLPGEGLPGRVYASRMAAWLPDVAQDDNFVRHATARQCGLRAGLGFPVLVGKEVVAVLEFFSFDKLQPDAQLLTVLSQIGTQLGRVIERQQSEQKLIHDASHDPLTGLPNRLLFLDRLSRAVARRQRHAFASYAVLFIDLDRFKLINDSLGHSAGDQLLCEIARRLVDALGTERSADKTSAEGSSAAHTLARLGGDEFTVLLEEIPHPSAAVEIAERLLLALRQPILLDGHEVHTGASIGIASSATEYASADDIMRDADLAMYRAKTQGRGRVAIFDPTLHDLAVERLSVESGLRRAMRDKEFVLHYQPIIALETDTVVGFEALLRWQRGPTDLALPAEFISIAEDTGMIVFIGAWVIQEACMNMARWHREYPATDQLSISVNVSPRQFTQPDFVAMIKQALNLSGLAPKFLRLEITEGVTFHNAERAIVVLEHLRDLGVRISIDDFGTGYSSLSYLHRLPFDTLKIDRSFITAMLEGNESRAIIQSILALARNMKMEVVAEGTELATHVAALRDMGCKYAQGFFFSKPVDMPGVQALLQRGGSLAGP